MSKQTVLYKMYAKGSPEKAVNAVNNIITKNNDKNFIKIIVSADLDDRLVCNEFFINAMKPHIEAGIVTLCYGKSKNVVEGMNRDIEVVPNWDVIVACPENMELICVGFDDLVRNLFRMNFPDHDGCLHFNDGKNGEKLFVNPIMGKAMYDKTGFIYDPNYVGEDADYGFCQLAVAYGKKKYYNNIAFAEKN